MSIAAKCICGKSMAFCVGGEGCKLEIKEGIVLLPKVQGIDLDKLEKRFEAALTDESVNEYLERNPLPKVQGGEEKRDETFEQYMSNSRNEFVRKINSNIWAVDLRVAAEDILICFDQMRERLSSPSSIRALEFAEWASDNYQSDYDGTWRTYIDSRAKIFNTRYTTAELYNIFINSKK